MPWFYFSQQLMEQQIQLCKNRKDFLLHLHQQKPPESHLVPVLKRSFQFLYSLITTIIVWDRWIRQINSAATILDSAELEEVVGMHYGISYLMWFLSIV